MKVFVSYSFIDSELHLLTLLFEKLRQNGHFVESSDYYNNDYKIFNSDLFLGIITDNSDSINEVVHEWEIAKKNQIKSILLVEEGVQIDDKLIKFIRFNRNNPEPSINKLFSTKQKILNRKKNDDVGDVLVGAGILVGIAALIALLAGGGKK